jgi:hypothetical protein
MDFADLRPGSGSEEEEEGEAGGGALLGFISARGARLGAIEASGAAASKAIAAPATERESAPAQTSVIIRMFKLHPVLTNNSSHPLRRL